MKSLLSAAMLALLALPANAQDGDVDFSGAYLGLNVNRSSSDSFDSASVVSATSNGLAISAGYLFDAGDFVVGGDLTYRRSNYSGTNVTTATALDGTITGAAVGLRVGYPMGRIMPYFGARVGRGTDDFGTGSFDFNSREITVGAEFALTESVFTNLSVERIRLDYRGTDLNLRSNVVALGLSYRF
ncbi:outer membrane protein [Rhodophyticola porphyridii]|nr:outer membrane beta-barrel protein [Rhodophyticola porphyridii]